MMRRLLLGLLPALFCIFMSAGAKAAVSCSATFPYSVNFGDVNILSGPRPDANGSINVSCTGIGATDRVRFCIQISGGAVNQWVTPARYLSSSTGGRFYYYLYLNSSSPPGYTYLDSAFYFALSQSAPSASISLRLAPAGGQTDRSVGSYSETLQFQTFFLVYTNTDFVPDCTSGGAASTSGLVVASATITPYCSVTASSMPFPSRTVLTTYLNTTSALTITCTKNAPYWIALDDGQYAVARQRRMKGSGPNDYLNYEIYTDGARTSRWGSTKDVDTLWGTGSSTAQSVPVYGQIPKPAVTPPPGNYSDTVSVTVNY